MTVELELTVNKMPIDTDYFVSGFIDHTVSGMIEALENTGKIKDLNLSIDGNEVRIILNGSDVPINAFVSTIIKGTTTGMVSTLKGVSRIETLKIVLHK
jgi:hypothetical protein